MPNGDLPQNYCSTQLHEGNASAIDMYIAKNRDFPRWASALVLVEYKIKLLLIFQAYFWVNRIFL